MNRTLIDFYRCPEQFAVFALCAKPSPDAGFFSFGPGTVCYGSIGEGQVCSSVAQHLYDAFNDVVVEDGRVLLSFNPDEVVENLRREQYCDESQAVAKPLAFRAYYLLRPLLGVSVRRYLQRFTLRNWRSRPFPEWPIDNTVERAHERLLRLCLQAHKGEEVPFIWFWPDGLQSCVSITHDVETAKGRDFCSTLMDLDENYGVKSSFQLIPEERYSLSAPFLESIRSRGFEVNVHDLNHDGRLFVNEKQFQEKVTRINQYGREFGAKGFRSGVLYRNLKWYKAFEFDYDMSVPNTAHLDPQHGGCCTVMPYFVGDITEIPLTTTQDYTLFHILTNYSIDLWQQQLEAIRSSHGIATFNVHPDYILEGKAQGVYIELLQCVEHLRREEKVWLALPGEVATWWRNRAQMRVIRSHDEWTIVGPDSQRARLAFARLSDNGIEYSWAATHSLEPEMSALSGEPRTLAS
jgi:hypothetical protein